MDLMKSGWRHDGIVTKIIISYTNLVHKVVPCFLQLFLSRLMGKNDYDSIIEEHKYILLELMACHENLELFQAFPTQLLGGRSEE